MSAALETIAAEAQQRGLRISRNDVGTRDERLVLWRDNEEVLLQIRPTLLGTRYVCCEEHCGDVMPPHWSDTLVANVRPGRLRAIYWWSYREIWGWLTYRPWRGFPEALAWLDVAVQRYQAEVQAILEQMEAAHG